MTSILYKNKIKQVLVISFWILAWQGIYMLINQPLLVPSPWMTIVAFGKIVVTSSTWKIVFFTAVKILIGYLIAVFLGVFSAVLAYRISMFEEIIRPIVLLTKSIPVASFIVVALAWLNAENISIFITAFVSFPMVYLQFYMSLKNTDKSILDMCKVFRVSSQKKIKYLYVPLILEKMQEVVVSTIGMAVRAAVAAELIGVPMQSIGEAIYKTKLYFDIAELFAWTILIIFLCLFMEKALKNILHCLRRRLYD